jgi:hypothetical protein
MRQAFFPIAAIALLVVVAGCGGVPDERPTRQPYDVTPTGTDGDTTTGSRATTASGSDAFRSIVGNHPTNLRNVGNFTFYHDESTLENPVIVLVDPGDRRYARASSDSTLNDVSVVTIQRDDVVYVKRSDDDRPGFVNVTASLPENSVTPKRWVTATTDLRNTSATEIPFERNGTVTWNGEPMTRYTASDPGPFRGARAIVRNVTRFHAVALVDDDGVIRKYAYTIEGRLAGGGNGEPYSERLNVSVLRVGNTTVPTGPASNDPT